MRCSLLGSMSKQSTIDAQLEIIREAQNKIDELQDEFYAIKQVFTDHKTYQTPYAYTKNGSSTIVDFEVKHEDIDDAMIGSDTIHQLNKAAYNVIATAYQKKTTGGFRMRIWVEKQ